MSPLTTRFFLGLTLVLAFGAAATALAGIIKGEKEAWATLAGALAVVTSMISAWGAQRVIELEEDKLHPYPYPQFDSTSRYGLLLLKLTNFGGAAAHNIRIIWDRPLLDMHNKDLRFSPNSTHDIITILLPGQHISKTIDAHHQFYEKNVAPHIFGGTLEFEDFHGRKKNVRFTLDAESIRNSPSYDTESSRTHYELQKIPNILKELCSEIDRVAISLERRPGNDSA